MKKCIRHTMEGIEKDSWCGKYLGNEWAFVDINHAVYSIQNASSIQVCDRCISEIIKILSVNKE